MEKVLHKVETRGVEVNAVVAEAEVKARAMEEALGQAKD